jgi:hypothetical protein
MAPTNEVAEVPQPLPIGQQYEKSTEDYCRDDMAVFEVSYLFGVRVLSIPELAVRLRALFSVFLNVSSSLVRASSNPCSLVRRKRAKTWVET